MDTSQESGTPAEYYTTTGASSAQYYGATGGDVGQYISAAAAAGTAEAENSMYGQFIENREDQFGSNGRQTAYTASEQRTLHMRAVTQHSSEEAAAVTSEVLCRTPYYSLEEAERLEQTMADPHTLAHGQMRLMEEPDDSSMFVDSSMNYTDYFPRQLSHFRRVEYDIQGFGMNSSDSTSAMMQSSSWTARNQPDLAASGTPRVPSRQALPSRGEVAGSRFYLPTDNAMDPTASDGSQLRLSSSPVPERPTAFGYWWGSHVRFLSNLRRAVPRLSVEAATAANRAAVQAETMRTPGPKPPTGLRNVHPQSHGDLEIQETQDVASVDDHRETGRLPPPGYDQVGQQNGSNGQGGYGQGNHLNSISGPGIHEDCSSHTGHIANQPQTNTRGYGSAAYNQEGEMQGYSSYTEMLENTQSPSRDHTRHVESGHVHAHAREESRMQLPSIHQVTTQLSQQDATRRGLGADREQSTAYRLSGHQFSSSQDLSAVPPSMRVEFNPLVTYEDGDFAQIRTHQAPEANSVSSAQVTASEFPAARFYERTAATTYDRLSQQQQLAQMRARLELLPRGDVNPRAIGPLPLPVSVPIDARRAAVAAEPGLRDYHTVLREIDDRALQIEARRTMNIQEEMAQGRSRNPPMEARNASTWDHFADEAFYDGFTITAARLSNNVQRQPVIARPIPIRPSVMRNTGNTIARNASIGRGQVASAVATRRNRRTISPPVDNSLTRWRWDAARRLITMQNEGTRSGYPPPGVGVIGSGRRARASASGGAGSESTAALGSGLGSRSGSGFNATSSLPSGMSPGPGSDVTSSLGSGVGPGPGSVSTSSLGSGLVFGSGSGTSSGSSSVSGSGSASDDQPE
ncbi:hypothetical protein SEUCBS139899_005226 [Sporothrix eucalyptigena]